MFVFVAVEQPHAAKDLVFVELMNPISLKRPVTLAFSGHDQGWQELLPWRRHGVTCLGRGSDGDAVRMWPSLASCCSHWIDASNIKLLRGSASHLLN